MQLATLPLEYKHVWKAKWSWVKGVYLVKFVCLSLLLFLRIEKCLLSPSLRRSRYWTLVYLIFEVVLLHGHVSPGMPQRTSLLPRRQKVTLPPWQISAATSPSSSLPAL